MILGHGCLINAKPFILKEGEYVLTLTDLGDKLPFTPRYYNELYGLLTSKKLSLNEKVEILHEGKTGLYYPKARIHAPGELMNNHTIEFARLSQPGLYDMNKNISSDDLTPILSSGKHNLDELITKYGPGLYLLNVCRVPCDKMTPPLLARAISDQHGENLSGEEAYNYYLERESNSLLKNIKSFLAIRKDSIFNITIFNGDLNLMIIVFSKLLKNSIVTRDYTLKYLVLSVKNNKLDKISFFDILRKLDFFNRDSIIDTVINLVINRVIEIEESVEILKENGIKEGDLLELLIDKDDEILDKIEAEFSNKYFYKYIKYKNKYINLKKQFQ